MRELKILIIDDDIQVLNSLGKLFTSLLQGCVPIKATSGNEGLNLLKSQSPDIVVVDVRLGSESGLDLIKKVKESDQSKKTPRFLVMTAFADKEIEKEAYTAFQVDKFLIKPFVQGEVEEAVLESLERVVQEELEQLKKEYETQLYNIRSAKSAKKRTKEKARESHKQLMEDIQKRNENKSNDQNSPR